MRVILILLAVTVAVTAAITAADEPPHCVFVLEVDVAEYQAAVRSTRVAPANETIVYVDQSGVLERVVDTGGLYVFPYAAVHESLLTMTLDQFVKWFTAQQHSNLAAKAFMKWVEGNTTLVEPIVSEEWLLDAMSNDEAGLKPAWKFFAETYTWAAESTDVLADALYWCKRRVSDYQMARRYGSKYHGVKCRHPAKKEE